ncbi:hypothetical protein DSM104329_00771 [Capillimicrobium parvum]|uniref:Uncharacterized protein n=1 Tax=Capillimicrobium parvum TaxID=2884022 RepID=A0A9E7BZG8_9ACTN|nr:hypothetical protein DSM104329_00771 [Capillimicrobium parvum]
MTIDLQRITAIDVHTHAQVPRTGPPDPITTEILDAASKHFRTDVPRPNADEVAEYYRSRNMAAVIFCVDNEANTGEVPVSNDGCSTSRTPTTTCSFRSSASIPIAASAR